MPALQYRLNRLFNAESGRALDVAVDHGFFGESSFLTGIEDMTAVIRTLVEAGPDAIQLTPGQAPLLQSTPGKAKPALVMRTDVANVYGNPVDDHLFSVVFPDAIEQAVRLDAAAVCINLLQLPGRPEIREACIRAIMSLRAAAMACGMPVMVEPLVMLDNSVAGGYQVDGTTARVVTLVRQARELGADLIKADPTTDIEDYHQVVEAAGDVPVLVRGGGRVDDDQLLRRTQAVLEQGARGIVYGRNVIQHPQPMALVAALMAILHDGMDAVQATEQLATSGADADMTRDHQPVSVGIIGGGLMGKEAALAFARWGALTDHPLRPELTHVCDIDPAALRWFDRIPSVVARSTDYHDLLGPDGPDVLYIAVRHDLHEQLYVDAIEAGASVLAEKPFGIDLPAAEAVLAAVTRHPESFVRCSSELPYFPGAQAAIARAASGALGRIIEVHSGFSHSSDLDPNKPINWKRQARYCGENGVLNDLGMHVLHVPLRLGWLPERVFAVLQDLVPSRPNPDGELVPCDTIENATMLCTALDQTGGGTSEAFPLHLTTKRIDPGQKNSWSLRVLGLKGGVEFCTRYPKTLRVMAIADGEQVWQEVEMGSQSAFATSTGGIFEFGFSDAIQQMWAAYLAERAGLLGRAFGCVTPHEAVTSHRVFAAALDSWARGAAVELP